MWTHLVVLSVLKISRLVPAGILRDRMTLAARPASCPRSCQLLK